MSTHPLDPLTPEELARAVEIVRKERELGSRVRFIRVDLEEPAKPDLDGGSPPNRRALVVILDNDARLGYEGIVDLEAGSVERWTPLDGIQPAISADEFVEAAEAVRADPDYREALARRGITGDALDSVHIEPWSVGSFETSDRRLARALSWLRSSDDDVNPYARPIGRLVGGRRPERDDASSASTTTASCRSRPRARDYRDGAGGPYRADLKPLEIVQPDGPSFVLDGRELRWQKWRMRIGFANREGLVLHQIAYEDDGELRSVCHRASIAELVIPYGDPSPTMHFKNVFDIGEYGLGPLVNELELGCDCLGEIRYLDSAFVDTKGNVAGAAQRHLHPRGGLRHPLEAPRRSHRPTRRRPIAPPGGVLRRDGRQLRVRLLLVLLPGRHDRVRGQADRDHAHRGRADRRRRAALDRGRPGRRRRLPPALLHRAPRHGR